MAHEDCAKIEKRLKEIIFNTNATKPNFLNNDGHQNAVDNNLFVSNIEENIHLEPNSKISHSYNLELTEKVESNNDKSTFQNTSSSSHINNSSFISNMDLNCKFKNAVHSELQNNSHAFKEINENGNNNSGFSLIDSITNEIKNSANFLKQSNNPLSENQSNNKGVFEEISSPILNSNHLAEVNDYQASDINDEQKEKKKSRKKRNKKDKNIKYSNSFKGSPDIDLCDLQHNNRKTNQDEEMYLDEDHFIFKKKILPYLRKEYELFNKQETPYFYCHLCNYNTSNAAYAINHFNHSSHREQKEFSEMDYYLPYLPEPLTSQIKAITELLERENSKIGMGDYFLDIRISMANRFKQYVKDNLPSCTVDLIGSSASGFGFKFSGMDFILRTSPEINPADALTDMYELLLKDEKYEDVFNDFKKKIPQIFFKDKESNYKCTISIHNEAPTNVLLAKLLYTYLKLDSRMPVLASSIRYWANICKIDQQDKGTLPAFCYALLLIYFLQRIEPPVLPVLHEVPGYMNTTEFLETYLLDKKWHSENTDLSGDLWIKFFHFYTYVYEYGNEIVSIRTSKKLTPEEKNWGTKFFSIEDPFSGRNLAYVIPTQHVFCYIQKCFQRTYRYFAYPRLYEGIVKVAFKDPEKELNYLLFSLDSIKNSIDEKEIIIDDDDVSENESIIKLDELLEDHDSDLPLDNLISTVSNISFEDKSNEVSYKETLQDFEDMQMFLTSPVHTNKELKSDKCIIETNHLNRDLLCWDIKDKNLIAKYFNYEFKARYFTGGDKNLPIICKSCRSKTHMKKDCPVEPLPSVCPLPDMIPEFLDMMNKVCNRIRDENKPSEEELKSRNNDMQEIQSYIRETFPGAKLSLFGSFCNGFGFKKSDMDFCLTFDDDVDGKNIDSIKVIQSIAEQLSKHPKLENVIPVTSAKVPIVKFTHKTSNLEGDISLYNTLAQCNTRMLEIYSKIDPRVQILGYVLKYFAKILGICDASRGSLSSYAYVLMVIFFLQQRNPPVVPVLQELHNGEKPEHIVEGWNAWFFDDLSKLPEVWADYGKNHESIGELWLGLLSFYACDFDIKEYVISIRQKNLLTRFKKLWITNRIAIEDPFDLNHNLGAGLSKNMNHYILKAFIRGRERFGTPKSDESMRTILGYEMKYLFDRKFLSDGQNPPIDRGCRVCGRIGHMSKDCKEKRNTKKPREKNDKDRAINRQQREGHERRNSNRGPNRRGNQQHTPRKNSNTDASRKNFEAHHAVNQASMLQGDQRILHQLGIPTYRMPQMVRPPGFQQPPPFQAGAPPGFPNLICNPAFSHQRPVIPAPFSYNHPQVKEQAKSPPKQNAASPPKKSYANGPLMATYHATPESPMQANLPYHQNWVHSRQLPSRAEHLYPPHTQHHKEHNRTHSENVHYSNQRSGKW